MVILDGDAARIRTQADEGRRMASNVQRAIHARLAELKSGVIEQCTGSLTTALGPAQTFLSVCFELDEQAPYWPFIAVLKSFAACLGTSMDAQAKLGIRNLFQARLIGSMARTMLNEEYLAQKNTLFIMLAHAERGASYYGVVLNLSVCVRDAVLLAAEMKEQQARGTTIELA